MSDVPSFNLSDIERRRNQIANALEERVGQAINADELASVVRGRLPAGVRYDTVFESVRYLAGRTLTADEALRLSARLAGNLKRLKEGKATPPWSAQHEDEWVPMQVLRMVKRRNNKDRLGYDATLRVLAGTPCPMKISAFWSGGALRLIASDVGFSRPWGKYPFKGSAALVGLRLLGRIEASRSQGRPFFHEVKCPQSMVNWNRENVLKLRLRVGQRCPLNYRHECWQCAIGYEQCQAATHYRTYQVGNCVQCGNAQAAFDPEDPSPHCVSCTAVARQRSNQQR